MTRFINRQEAGRLLALQLQDYAHDPNVLVLALPRGGVPVAYEIAKALSVGLDVLIVRKLGVPGHEELALGAIASGGAVIFNEAIIQTLSISEDNIHAIIHAEKQELERREFAYRGHRPFPLLRHKTIILVDDGIATGATMRAAIQSIHQQRPVHLIIAVPVAPPSIYRDMARHVDKMVCLLKPIDFYAVGQWYVDFSQTSDAEVTTLLASITQP